MEPVQASTAANTLSWWREREFWLLAALALLVHGARLTALPLRGEETRWARIAVEMLDRGNWLVPTLQGETYTDRPPLGSWTIAASMRALGREDALAARLPALLATLLTTLLVYVYARSWQSTIGAFASGAAYATFVHVLQFGGLAENEALFTLWLGGGLLIWNLGYERDWPPALYWSLGSAMAGLATLTKGVQGVVFFGGGVVLFLLVRRRWWTLFSWRLALGIVVGAAVVAAWLLPFAAEVGRYNARLSLLGPVQGRVSNFEALAVARHLARFPFEFLACLLPWSPLLFVFARRDFRRSCALPGSQIWFLLACIAAAFPTCWLSAGARARYLMPIYPCVAPLVGLVIARAWGTMRQADAARSWCVFLRVMGGLMLAIVIVVAVVGSVPAWRGTPLTQPPLFIIGWGSLVLAVAWAAWQASLAGTRLPPWAGPAAIVAFLGMVYGGLWTNAQAMQANDIPTAIARLRAKLPIDARLVSYGPVHHPFLYHFRDSVPRLPPPTAAEPADPAVEYFCFLQAPTVASVELPFAWEQVDAIVCDRRRNTNGDRVIVGRRLPAIRTATQGSATQGGASIPK